MFFFPDRLLLKFEQRHLIKKKYINKSFSNKTKKLLKQFIVFKNIKGSFSEFINSILCEAQLYF